MHCRHPSASLPLASDNDKSMAHCAECIGKRAGDNHYKLFAFLFVTGQVVKVPFLLPADYLLQELNTSHPRRTSITMSFDFNPLVSEPRAVVDQPPQYPEQGRPVYVAASNAACGGKPKRGILKAITGLAVACLVLATIAIAVNGVTLSYLNWRGYYPDRFGYEYTPLYPGIWMGVIVSKRI